MSKMQELEKLFEEWKSEQMHEENSSWERTKGSTRIPKSRFCEDGIIDEDAFEKAKIKVLFISNEANDDNDTDYPKAPLIDSGRIHSFREYYETKTDSWRGKLRERICALYQVIIGDNSPEHYLFAKSFAFININKRGGGDHVRDDHILNYLKRFKAYIRKEIEIINPDLIVWVGKKTFHRDLIIDCLGAEADKKTCLLYLNNAPIISMPHTSYFPMIPKNVGTLGMWETNRSIDKAAVLLMKALRKCCDKTRRYYYVEK